MMTDKRKKYGKSRKEKILNILITFFSLTALTGFLCTGVYIGMLQMDAMNLNRVRARAGVPASDENERKKGPAATGSFKEPEPTADAVLQNLKKLREENSDLAGWISIPDTAISYPVMYTPEEKEYYLHRNFEGNYSPSGLPFLDGDSVLSPRCGNLIIYGHNMKNGRVFAGLLSYDTKKFQEKHRTLFFYTPQERQEYEVVAALYLDAFEKEITEICYRIEFSDKQDFEYYFSRIQDLALYDTGVRAK